MVREEQGLSRLINPLKLLVPLLLGIAALLAAASAHAHQEEFAAFLRAETAKWAKVVRDAGLQPE